MRGLCEATPAGCTIDEAEQTVDELLGRAEVVRLGASTCARSDAVRLADGCVLAYRSARPLLDQELLAKERRIIDLAIILRADGRPHVES